MAELKDYIYYCTKCGWFSVPPRDDCPFCQSVLKKYDCQTTEFFDLPKEEQKRLFSNVQDIIENSPDYDHKLHCRRLEEEKRYNEASIRKMHSNKVVVTCPYCHSNNTRKIGAGERMVTANLFGLGSQNLGKQWHCRNCGSNF